jgi:nitrite reductase (NADH) small subunit
MAEVFVCKAGELKEGAVRIIRTASTEIGIYYYGSKYYAYRNKCVHQGGPACEGVIIGKVVELLSADRQYIGQSFDDNDPHIVCPWHGWEYRLLTGEHAGNPKIKLMRYDVVQHEGSVYVVA